MIQKLSNIQTRTETSISPAPSTLMSELFEDDFVDRFNREPFKVGHNLSDHKLFSLESLIELSKSLPEDRVEYNAGDLPVTQDPGRTPQNGLSIADTIQRIENCDSWMVLKNVERNAAYKELLMNCLSEIKEYSDLVSPGMKYEQGFIFISSPGSVTPFHIDPENNFLLQILGSKKIRMFGQNDREVLSENEIEEFFDGAHRNLEFKESYRDRGQSFELVQGEGLHFPVVAPHYVENGPEVSISFSVTFQTKDSADRQSLHRLNKKIRKLGLTPSNVGASAWRDRTKLAGVSLLRAVKNLTGRKSTCDIQ